MTITGPRTRLAWGMLVLGLVALAWCGRTLWFGIASIGWPRVEAVVLESRLIADRTGKGRSTIVLRYEYPCGASRCTSDRWRFKVIPSQSDTLWDTSRIEYTRGVVASFPVGSQASVAVNPSDPSMAVAEPGASIEDAGYALIGLLFALGGLGVRREPRTVANRAGSIHPVVRVLRGGGSALTLLGLLGVAIGAWVLYRDFAGTSWPAVQGRVVYATAGKSGGIEGFDARAHIRYEYTLDGRRWFGTAQRIGTRPEIAAFAAAFPVGAPIPVRVNPLWSADSVTENAFDWKDTIALGVGLVLLLLGRLLGAGARRLTGLTDPSPGHS